jgi:hypothetical protein
MAITSDPNRARPGEIATKSPTIKQQKLVNQ